ncbi:MAG: hypothetical protein WDW36_006109 [Sanguina aurantia]
MGGRTIYGRIYMVFRGGGGGGGVQQQDQTGCHDRLPPHVTPIIPEHPPAPSLLADCPPRPPPPLHLLSWQLPLLESLAATLGANVMALLVGPSGSGKTRMARLLARLAGRTLLEVPLTAGTDTSDLLGSFEQLEPSRRVAEASTKVCSLLLSVVRALLMTDSSRATAHTTAAQPCTTNPRRLQSARDLHSAWDAHRHAVACGGGGNAASVGTSIAAQAAEVSGLQAVLAACVRAVAPTASDSDAAAPFASPLSSLSSTLAALSALLSDESSHAVGGRFEWVDGSLARAIEHGGWVLLDNANLCNPTVLDRLNPLLEPGGVLFLNECGHTADGPRLIRPHPDFRLILAMDPKHGDVSRAMRNRGIEICVLQPPSTSHPSPSPPTTTTTTTTTPTHPSQALPDSGIISDDFASSSDSCWLLSSEGVAGSVLPAAMAHAHAGAVELCRAAHKRPPGSRELCCWAALARTLLQRGWSLPEALQTGWEQAYVQSATLTPAQLAAMYALCADACAAAAAGPEPTVPSADGPGSTVLITGGTGDMDVDITPAAAALAGSAHVGGSSVQEWVEEQSSDGSAGGHRLVAPQLMAVALVAPCKWPASAVSGRELADGSLLGGVMRDSSLVEALLGMCLTAQIQIHPLASTPSHPSTRSSWLELTAESGSATPRSRLSPLQQASLRFLPAPQLAHLLHNRALSTSSTASQQQQQQQREMDLTPSQQQQRQQECEAAVTRLQVAAWTALQVGCASRASSGDVSLRLMWANSTAAGLQAAEATLLPGHSGLGPMGQLASLSSAYLHEVMSHPLTGQLRSTTRSTLAQAGMSEELLQLQPLDLRYTHLLQPYKSCIDAETWAALMQLQQRWGALLAHTGASILQRHAATESEARMGGGVEGGGASVFQLSCWRHARPDDRAAIELELPAVDHLYPVFAAVADLEAALLQPSCSWIWSSDVTFQLESVQRWRQALWHCCHGPLHTPHPSATLHTLHVDRLIWVWTHLSKELRRLATAVSAAIASTPTPPTATTHPHSQPSSHTTSTPAGVHDITGSSSSSSSEEAVAVMEGLGRMRYCLDQMNESLGLSSRPSRPLVWRLCGRPLLPPTGALLLAQQRVQGLCRALGGGSSSGGCYTLDGRGRPAGLADAGIDVDSMLVQLLEGGGAAAAVGMMDGGSAVLASRGPLRARAMAAVAASFSSSNPRSEPATTRKGGRKSKAEVPAAVVDAAAVTAAAAATAATVSQALAVAAVLQEQVIARIQAVLQGVLAASSSTAVDEDGMEDENRGGEEDVAGEVFCPAAGAVVEASGQLQLPSEWMKSAVTRQLATALTPLQDASGVLSQMDVLSLLSTTTFAHSLPSHPDHTSATTTTTTTITDHNPSDARHHSITIPSAIALLGAVTQRLDTAATNGTGEPLSLAPYQQLAWVLEEAVNNGRGRTDLALSSPAEEGKAAEDWRQLVGGPVTSLAHEIWFRWLQRAAGSTFVTGADGALSSCGGPFRLYLASITYALPTLVRPSLSDVSSKTVRLLQLKLTARSLQQMASASASSASHTTAHPTPTLHHQTTLQLTALFCQLVAAHASTLGDDDSGSSSAAALLRLLQLLLWAAQAACSSSGASAATAAAVAAAVAAVPGQLVGVLSGSSHAVLLSLLQPVLLPCVVTLTECVSAGLVLSRTTSSPLHPTPALESLHGRAWTLLGLLRLHLVAPPPGIDPAGKYSLKRDHLDSEIHGSIAPELQVRTQLQRLPGGPDEAPQLAALARARSARRAQRDRASAKCVPRPSPPQYQTLQRDVASFCSSLGSASRIVNLLPAPYDSSSNMPAEAWPALSSAQSWLSSAAAWQDRLGVQYPSYVDLLQPVQLALLEMSHGLGILVGSAEAEAAMPLGQRAQLQAAVAMLMAFPQPLPPSLPQLTQPGSDDAQAVAVGAGGVAQDVESGEEDPLLLGAEGLQSLLAARAAAAAAASCAHIGPEQAAKAAQLASFSTRLQAGRTALHLLTRHLVAAGPAQLQLAAATSTATPTPTPTAALTLSPSHGSADGLAGSGVHTAVMRCESLLSSFITSWARIKAFEELEAEADGSVYKASKTVNNSIQTEEEESEASYLTSFPDHYAAFSDLAVLDGDQDVPDPVDEHGNPIVDPYRSRAPPALPGAGNIAVASEGQARSSSARALLDGELLADLVHLHHTLFSNLSHHALASSSSAAAAAAAAVITLPAASFVRCYELGMQLVGRSEGLLSASLDSVTMTGHLYRSCVEHMRIGRAAASTAAAAAAGGGTTGSGGGDENDALVGAVGRGRTRLAGDSKRGAAARARMAASGGGDVSGEGVDMQAACVEEVTLLQGPAGAMDVRLRDLLAQFPDHPLLQQLRTIVQRLLSMQLSSPLKAALTGLELLLSRAQLWQETAASYVSLAPELALVASLATRWRKLELASWKNLLSNVQRKHAAGSNKSWFHMYRLLSGATAAGTAPASVFSDSEAAKEAVASAEAAVAPAAAVDADADAADASADLAAGFRKVKHRDGDEFIVVAAEVVVETPELAYRRIAATLEHFVQTSTIGEFAARLEMLRSFESHLQVRHQLQLSGLGQAPPGASSSASLAPSPFSASRQLASALSNTVRYYAQFLPSIQRTITEGMAPIEKDLRDFVSLAKWEDRGYYAMRASTEKAQRHLHRLSRHAPAPDPYALPLTPAAAVAAAAAAAAAARSQVLLSRAAAKANRAAVAAAEAYAALDASELVFGQDNEEDDDEDVEQSAAATAAAAAAAAASLVSTRRADKLAWNAFCSGCTAVANTHAAASLPTATTDGSGGAAQAADSSSSGYSQRLPQLLPRLAKVLTTSLFQAPARPANAITAEGAGPAGQQGAAPDGAEVLDDLAVAVAQRAVALRGDVTKGARSRKKKAVTDALRSLSAAGVSRRVADVPAEEREITSWFKQPACGLHALLHRPTHLQLSSPTPVHTPSILPAASAAWSKADLYYFRTIARLQKLWRAALQPHRDVTLAETAAACRYVEHMMFVARKQRTTLACASTTLSTLTHLADWFADVAAAAAAAGSAQPGVAAPADPTLASEAARTGSDSISAPPPQAAALSWMQSQSRTLTRLLLLLPDSRQLLSACLAVAAVNGQQAQLRTAVALLDEATAEIAASKGALDAALADSCISLSQTDTESSAATAAAVGGETWVTHHAWGVLTGNYAQLGAIHAQLSGSSPVPGDASTSALPVGLPGVDQVLAELSLAAADATAFQALLQQPSPSSCTVTDESSTGAGPPVDPAASAAVDDVVRELLLWAQSSSGSATAATAAAPAPALDGRSTEPVGLPCWTAQLETSLQLPRAGAVAATATALLHRLASLSATPSRVAGTGEGVAAVLPSRGTLSMLASMLRLSAAALQQRALRAVALHKATVKLALVCAAVASTLVEEGFCMPESGKEVEGGDGNGEFQEAEGTGLGEGEGVKDISDKLDNEDQLLGAEQADKEKPDQQDPGGEDQNEAKGIEMEADFDGELHDVEMEDRDADPDGEEDPKDDERLDQQMGDVGDNEEVVDEKLWGDDDDAQEEGKDKKEEKYENDAPIQVEDKSELEYGAGQEEAEDGKKDKKDKKGEKAPEKPQGEDKQEDGADPEEAKSEGADEEEGGVNNDTDDKYEDKNNTALEAPEDEMKLPEDLNLDPEVDEPATGPEAEQPEAEETAADKPAGAEEEGKDADAAKEGEGEDGAETGKEEEKGQEGAEDEEMDADGARKEGADGMDDEEQQKEEDPEAPPAPGGAALAEEEGVAGEEPPPPEEEEPEAVNAHGMEEERPEGQEAQQAGPKGLPSAATKQQAKATGKSKGEEPPTGDEDEQAPNQDAAGMDADDADDSAPDAAPQAHHSSAGMTSSVSAKGALQPLGGGDEGGPPPPRPPPAAGKGKQRPPKPLEANPLRSLGDAMERWRAKLTVQHEAPKMEEEEDEESEGAAHDDDAPEDLDRAGAAPEFEFVAEGDKRQAGDTQALAPATEEQAATAAKDAPQPADDAMQDPESKPADDANLDQTMEEADAPADDPAEADDQSKPMVGKAPKSWAGPESKKTKPTVQRPAEADDGGVEAEEEGGASEADEEDEAGEDVGEGADVSSLVVARTTAGGLLLGEAKPGGAEVEGRVEGEGEDGVEELTSAALTQEQVDLARRQLDERLRAGPASLADGCREGDAAYGAEVWARCEGLTAGLAAELTEQMRLILEPTTASKLAGDYRTGKRINMKKVIGYIASHFRKDKIWMRRTRPDKRRYQVLLAIDDSRSMAENGCAGRALEALALICKAMSRLDVGQVGVLKFGSNPAALPSAISDALAGGGSSGGGSLAGVPCSSVASLHALETPFTDAVGPTLASALRFDADHTIAGRPMAELMEALSVTLESARHRSGAGGIGAGTQDMAQLVLILADGRFHEREGLMAAVRAAAAKPGVCLAFIALDNPAASLLDMQSVSFAGGKPTFTKYLDAFPFPYYIVLRDIAALPRTLADLMRQWFELSAA